jgi:hypothetical protein
MTQGYYTPSWHSGADMATPIAIGPGLVTQVVTNDNPVQGGELLEN